jgi:branched-chain amino acid transport system substrate-binding protein
VELAFGCAGEGIGAMEETRRLVELEGVDVLIGPNYFTYKEAMVEYARLHPETTFISDTMEHLTASEQTPNLFRFTADAVQTSAGLGSYARKVLGWRRAATLAAPDLWGWGAQAGFVAEFCSLGGKVANREWLDAAPDDIAATIEAVPLGGADGFFVTADLPSSASTFLQRFAQREPRLARRIVYAAEGSVPTLLDPAIVQGLGELLEGVVTASSVPLDRSWTHWNDYDDAFREAFPKLASTATSAYHLYDIDFYNAMEAVMRALETVHGDLSDGAERFQETLGAIRLDAPNGTITLDEDRQAVVPIYLSRVVKGPEGILTYDTFQKVPGVDQTYGGIMPIDAPTPDRTQPPCRKTSPPRWATAF